MVRSSSSATVGSYRLILIYIVLTAVVLAVFGQTGWFDFVNYDDGSYVFENANIRAGLTWRGVIWAFTHIHSQNWHPLTIISHMIDCQIFGLKAGGHHFTNVLLHTIAALLLFVFLQAATQRFWRATFVTAIFAIHPLRVESVAWIAERKDVLSAVFFFLTLGVYARYARAQSLGRYLTMSILFVCGLMSKPMLVTTPVILLLLDYWPLGRVRDLKSCWRLVFEKLPLFALSLGSSIVTFWLQVRSPESVGQLPFLWRLRNALVTYLIYIGQIFWPMDLAVFYPHPDDRLALWQVAFAAAFLIAITWLVFPLRRNRPYLLVGWLWYSIMLVPVIGIVEVGLQGHADRYTYLPHIGLYIALTWLAVDLSSSLPYRKQIFAALGGAIIMILSAGSWKQTTYWRNSETLWTHTLAVTKGNDVAHTNLGLMLMDRAQLDDALSHFRTALDIRSSTLLPHYDLNFTLILTDIGNVLARKGRLEEAIAAFRLAIEFNPGYPDAHYDLGVALFQRRDLDGAIAELQTVLSLHPNDPGTNTSLANVLVQKGLLREAANHYETALQSEPDSPLPLNNLAWLMSAGLDDSLRNGARAVELARKANRISKQNNPFYVRTLAAAYAETGQFDVAIETAQSASELANAQGQHGLALQIQKDTDLYHRHLPLRDKSLSDAH